MAFDMARNGWPFLAKFTCQKIATLKRNYYHFLPDSFVLLLRPLPRKIYNLSRRIFSCEGHQRLRMGLHTVSLSRFAKALELLSRFRHFNSDFPTCFALSFYRKPRKRSWYAFWCFWVQFLPSCFLWPLVYLFLLSQRSREACFAKQRFWCFEGAGRTCDAFCFYWILPASSPIYFFCLRCSLTIR